MHKRTPSQHRSRTATDPQNLCYSASISPSSCTFFYISYCKASTNCLDIYNWSDLPKTQRTRDFGRSTRLWDSKNILWNLSRHSLAVELREFLQLLARCHRKRDFELTNRRCRSRRKHRLRCCGELLAWHRRLLGRSRKLLRLEGEEKKLIKNVLKFEKLFLGDFSNKNIFLIKNLSKIFKNF